MNHRHVLVLMLLAATGLANAGAGAAEPDARPTRVVSFADLNLATSAGKQQLELRLQAAARSVCAPLDGRDLRQRAAWRECVAQALAGARAALPATALAAQADR